MPAGTVTGDQDRLRETRADVRRRLTGDGQTREERARRGPGEDLTPPAERAAREGRGPRTKAQIFGEMDPQEWACRSQEHHWPQLLPGATEIPRGMRVSAAGRGNVLFEEDCLHDCGRYRETLTERGFAVVWRRYGTRKGRRHTVIHQDETLTKAEMRESTLSASKDLIRAAIRAPAPAVQDAGGLA